MVLVFAVAAYLAFWPVPIKPVSWQAPDRVPDPHVGNTSLVEPDEVDLQGGKGPESVTQRADGTLYLGVEGGDILRIAAEGATPEVFVNTGGRPLGLATDGEGRLIVADAVRGLLSIAADGAQTVLLRAGSDADARIFFPNAVAVAGNGKIYVTDSSARFTAARWKSTKEAAMLDVFEQSASGRVLEYDPRTGQARVLAHGLSLPNGIVLSADEQRVLVSESGRYRIWEIATSADRLDLSMRPASARVVLDNLPAYPDNLTRGLHGRIWLGLAGQRNMLDQLADRPLLRKVILRIPRFMWSMPKPIGHVLAFTEDGTVVADLRDPSGHSPTTTGATETATHLYIHNVDGGSLGRLSRERVQTLIMPARLDSLRGD